jgi:cellulose synthase/poly-beta-1,6-N-acetylglucosamine synthase-like glycosyltransferase
LTITVGLWFGYIALVLGVFYFSYAVKYYVSTIIALRLLETRTSSNPLPLENIPTENSPFEPFISIHLPFYNEINVANRIINACIDINYTNYEVLVADDSVDDTVDILKSDDWRVGKPIIKFIHRGVRSGYKGGALRQATRHMHPDTEYVVVFDADFVPPPDILKGFLDHFRRQDDDKKPVAAVQGYQLHYLNKTENWLTKGVRTEFSGSYMVERVAEEALGSMKMISGSVFMLKASVLRELGWTTSITEDWELTLRLYLKGYRVVYTPLIQAPAEIPNSVGRLLKQRMRWAEGHTFAVRRYFWRVLKSSILTKAEKLEFLYFAPYYLQSMFLMVGTLFWAASEFYRGRPPFWTPSMGWGLILSNFLAIPIMGLAGIFLEGDLREDFSGVFGFIALSYIVAPYQAYAALKGLLESEEGVWIRTLKTGKITNSFLGLKFRIFISWLRELRRNPQGIRHAETFGGFPVWMPMRGILMIIAFSLILLPVLDFVNFSKLMSTISESYVVYVKNLWVY